GELNYIHVSLRIDSSNASTDRRCSMIHKAKRIALHASSPGVAANKPEASKKTLSVSLMVDPKHLFVGDFAVSQDLHGSTNDRHFNGALPRAKPLRPHLQPARRKSHRANRRLALRRGRRFFVL